MTSTADRFVLIRSKRGPCEEALPGLCHTLDPMGKVLQSQRGQFNQTVAL